MPPPQVVEGPSDEEVAAQGSGKLPTGFDPAAWVGDGKPGQVMDLKAGDVFLGTDGKLWQVRKPSQKGFVMAQVIDLATGLNGSAGAMVPYKEKVSQKAVSVTPYESLLPGDAATLDKLQVGDQFRLNLGGDLFQVMAMKPYGDEQEVTVTAVQADGMPDPSFFKLAPGVGTYLHAKAADVPLPVADKNDYLTDVESLPDAVATNGYKSYAFHKSGTKKYPKIQTMAEGTIFHDSAGTTYKVKKAGVAPVITDGKKLFKINGNLRGFVLPDGKLDDAAAPQPVMDAQTVQSAGAKAGLTDNAKSQAISELKLKVGDHVFFDPKTMGLLGSDEVWQVTALDKPSLSVSLYGLATGKTKAVSTTMVPSMYKVAPEAPSLFPEVQPGAEGIPGPEAFTVSVNLPADLGVGDYFSIDAAGGPKQTVWQVTKKAGGHATEFVMVQGVNVGKKYGGVSMPQSGLMAKGALKQAPGAVPQTGYQPYSSEAELSVGDFFTYKSPEAQPDTTIWQVLEMSGGKVTGYREVWSAGKPKPDGLEKHGEAGDVGMLAAGWYAKGGAPAGEWGSGPTSPKIANPEDWNPAAWTKGGTMDLSDVPAGTFVAWNSGYYKVLGEDPKYPQYKAKFMQGLGPDASQQYSGDLGKSSAVGDTNVTIMTPDPTVTVPGAPSQYTKLVGDDPASFVPEMWEPTGQVMDMEDAPDGSVVHKLDYGTKAPTGKYLYVVDSSTYQGSEPGKFGKNVKSLGEDAGYDYPHSGASPVEIMQPKLAGTPAAPTPAVPQTLPPESPVLAKKAKMGELPVGALVQSGGYTGKVSKVISHDAGGEYPQTQLEVVKPDSEPGSSPYGNEIGNTWSVYSTNPATPLIGPMWKPGEIVKVVKTGNKTGKTAKIIEGGNSKVTIKYADGKVASNVPVEWLHPVTGVHYTTKQKLKMDTRPGKSLNVGDVVTSAYGGPQVVIEKDGEGGGTLLNWGADPVSPMWYQKTPIKVDQDYEMLMTAGQLTRGAGGPLPEAMPSGPPPVVPSPDDFVHLETVAAGNFTVGTVFAVEEPKTHPDAPMWKVTKQNPSSTELMIVKADVSGMAGNQAQPVSSEWSPAGGFWVAHELTAKIVPSEPSKTGPAFAKQIGKKADWEHVEPGDFLGVAPTVLRVISQKPDDQVMTQIVSGASDLQGDFTDGDLFLAGLGPNAQWSWAAPVTMPKVPHKGAWLDQVEPGDVLENHDGSNVVQVTGKTGATVHTKVLKSSAQNMQDHPVGAAWDISLKGHLLKPESEGVPGGVEHGGHSWRWADPAEVLKAAELEPLGKQVGQPVDSPMDLSKGDIIVFDKGGDAESTWKVVEPPDAPSAQFQLQALAVPDHNLVDVKPGDEQAHSFLGGMSASHWTWGDPSLKEMTFGGPESEPALAPSGEFNPDQWEAAPEQLDPDELDSLPLGTIVTDELSAPSNPWFWELVGHDPPMVKVLWSQSGSFMGDVDPAAEFTSTQFQVSTPKGQKPVSPTAGFNVSSLPAPSGEFNPDEWEAANEELDAPELDSLPLGTVLTDPLSSPNNVWFYEVVEHDPPMVKILHTPGAGHFIGDVDSAEDYGPYQIATPKGTTPVVVSPTASFDKTRYEVAGAMATVSELKPGTVITDNKGHHWWKVVDPETRDLEILVWPENPASAGSHDKADSDGKFVPMQPKGTPVKREWKPGDSVTFTEGGSWYEGEVVGPGQHPGDVMVGITGSSDTGTEGKTWAIPAEWLLPLKVEGPTKGPRKGSPLMTPAEFNPDEWELDDVYEAGDLSDSVGAVIHTLPPSSDSYYQVIEPAVAADTGMPAPRVRTLLTHGESPAPGVEFVLYPGAKAELLKPKVSEPEIAPVDPKILDTSINPLSVSPGDYIYGGTKKTTYQVVGIPYYSGGDLVADLKDTKTGKVEQKQALTTFWQWAPDPGGATTSGAAGKFNPEDWEAGGLKLQTLAGIETLAPGTIVTDGPGETEVPWWWEVVDPAAGKLKLLWMSNGPPSESVLKGTEDAKDWLPLWSATRKGAAAAPGPPGEPLDVLKPYSPKYHKSGSHKTPQIGTLAVGQQFHDKSGKTYEVVSNSGGVDGSVNYRLVVEAAPGLGEMLYVTSGQSRVVVKGT